MDLSIKNGGSFHSYVNVYRRVHDFQTNLGIFFSIFKTPEEMRLIFAHPDAGTSTNRLGREFLGDVVVGQND